jgi:hypothetical protein
LKSQRRFHLAPNSKERGNIEYNTENLGSGAYVIVVEGNGEKKTYKFVVYK